MKYKVGDKVRIRNDLKIGSVYGTCCVTLEMHNLGGAIVRIVEANEYSGEYRIDSFGCYWADEMFEEDKKEMNNNDSIRIIINGNQVIAIHMENGKKGVARCHPDDDFDFYIGAKLALERLEEADNPFWWLKEGVRYYVPQVTFADLHDTYVYSADDFDKRNMERGTVFQTKKEAIECAKKMLAAVKKEG